MRERPWLEPRSWSSWYCSYTVTSAPRAVSAQAAAQPITPAPTTATRVTGRMSTRDAVWSAYPSVDADAGRHARQDHRGPLREDGPVDPAVGRARAVESAGRLAEGPHRVASARACSRSRPGVDGGRLGRPAGALRGPGSGDARRVAPEGEGRGSAGLHTARLCARGARPGRQGRGAADLRRVRPRPPVRGAAAGDTHAARRRARAAPLAADRASPAGRLVRLRPHHAPRLPCARGRDRRRAHRMAERGLRDRRAALNDNV